MFFNCIIYYQIITDKLKLFEVERLYRYLTSSVRSTYTVWFS